MTAATDEEIKAKFIELGEVYGQTVDTRLVEEFVAWLRAEQYRTMFESLNDMRYGTRYGVFNKIIADDGRVLRDWWPEAKESTIKSWVRRHHPAVGSAYKIEYRRDIEADGNRSWFQGKMCGGPGKLRYPD